MLENLLDKLRIRLKKRNEHGFLQQFSLFKELNTHELQLVHNCLHPREFQSGDVIFCEGFPVEALYFIVEGEAAVLGYPSRSDTIVLHKHQFIGIIDLFSHDKRLSSASAKTDLKVLALPITDFWELIRRDKALGVKILSACCQFLGKYLITLTIPGVHDPEI